MNFLREGKKRKKKNQSIDKGARHEIKGHAATEDKN